MNKNQVKKKITLQQYRVSTDTLRRLLEYFPANVKVVDSLSPYFYGYKDKHIIYYNGSDTVVCQYFYINEVTDNIQSSLHEDWKQVIIKKDDNFDEGAVKKDLTGSHCFNIAMSKMTKYGYTKEELEAIMSSYDTKKDNCFKQYHRLPSEWIQPFDTDIQKVSNCYYFDLNGAHNDALREMFPKAEKLWTKMYNERKEHPENKMIANYFVGMMKRLGYEGAYNWIVQRTTKMLYNVEDQVEGTLLYANTDGIIVKDPVRMPDNLGTGLGQCKVENDINSDMYFQIGKNYWVMQYTDDKGEKVIKGNALCGVREHIALDKGISVEYSRMKYKDYRLYYVDNINEIKLNIKEIN